MTFFSNTSIAANLTASVDRNVIGLDETFVLTLRYDEQINAAPDYTLLERNFDILNTQSRGFMGLMNGRTENYTEWKIILAPKKIGTALIPAFKINDAVSDAIQITVEGNSTKSQDMLLLDIKIDKTQAFVQEQLLVTLRMKTFVNINGPYVDPLQIKDAVTVLLDDKKYRDITNGRDSIIFETTYAVFPQQSGELIIPSVLYQVELVENRHSFFINRGNLIRLRTEEKAISIKPTPNDSRAQPWLPAKDIRIEEHWSSSPDAIKVGEPITRTLTIRADGLSAGQLPPLPGFNLNGLNVYQDQAQNDDQKSEQGVLGSRIETTAIVANQPGTFTLPAINLHWWDTDEQTFKTATLAESTLKVSGIATTQTTPASPDTTEEITVPLNTDVNNLPQQSPVVSKTPLWIYALLALSVLINLVLAVAYWRARRNQAEQQEVKAYFASEALQTEKAAWQALREALATKDLLVLRKAIIHWGRIVWKDEQLSTLDSLAKKSNAPGLKQICDDIDAAIYGNKEMPASLDTLLEILARLRKSTATGTKSELDNLYPS